MDRSVYQKWLGEDMQRLEKQLARVVKSDATLRRKIASSGDMQLLNLACGACHEARTLANVFGGRGDEIEDKRNMQFVGLDVRAREIAEAADRFPGDPNTEFSFINGDATKLETYGQLPGAFDVIFMRHQNLWDGKRVWEEIYHKALDKLSPDGRLIITSYFDREHSEAIGVIENQGGELLINRANEESRSLGFPGKSVDRHVAILKRER